MSGIDPIQGLLYVLGLFTIFFIFILVRAVQKHAVSGSPMPTAGGLLTGLITNFFDALGIGSFATTTTVFRWFKMVPDEKIPGTLNVGHTLPTIFQAFIFTATVPVDPKTLILLIISSVIGSYFGAGIVSSWPRRKVQIGMGLALTGAAILMGLRVMNDFSGSGLPSGGSALGLIGMGLILGMVGNLILGAFMTVGIGLYAPCMIMVFFLGMDAKAAFPIMMGSCAFLMPVASAKFIKTGAFDIKATLGLALGGLVGVFLAWKVVSSLPLQYVRGLVVVVVFYAAYGLLSTARREAMAGTGGAGSVKP